MKTIAETFLTVRSPFVLMGFPFFSVARLHGRSPAEKLDFFPAPFSLSQAALFCFNTWNPERYIAREPLILLPINMRSKEKILFVFPSGDLKEFLGSFEAARGQLDMCKYGSGRSSSSGGLVLLFYLSWQQLSSYTSHRPQECPIAAAVARFQAPLLSWHPRFLTTIHKRKNRKGLSCKIIL